MKFEADIAQLNESYFFREFTFSRQTFRPTPKDELELADTIVWLDNLLIVYQIKEREKKESTTSEIEERWFQQKVIGKATRQIRDTMSYLRKRETINVSNHRGHTFTLSHTLIESAYKVVVYLPSEALSVGCRFKKCHRSKTANVFIHLFSASDYLGILKILVTPAEVAEYLSFRESLVERWNEEVSHLPEQALVGQYLKGEVDARPSEEFADYLGALSRRYEEWDLSRLMNLFSERITDSRSETDYYKIIGEIGKLNRGDLKAFKERLVLSMEKAKADHFTVPYRIAIPRTGCGFVFVPLTKDLFASRRNALLNFTHAHKYDQKLSKCVGVVFGYEQEGWYSVDWCYAEFPWQQDLELEERLRTKFPFRKVRFHEEPRYTFDVDK